MIKNSDDIKMMGNYLACQYTVYFNPKGLEVVWFYQYGELKECGSLHNEIYEIYLDLLLISMPDLKP